MPPGYGQINLGNPVNRAAPVNRGLVAWYYGLPNNSGGQYWYDLLGGYPVIGGTTAPAWALANYGLKINNGLSFVRASSQYLTSSTLPVAAAPLTLESWCICTDTTDSQELISIGAVGAATSFRLNINGSAKTVRAITTNSGNGISVSAGTWTSGKWMHAAAVFANTASRTAYLDGVPGATDTTSLSAPTPDTLNIGRLIQPGPTNYFNGTCGSVRIYNLAKSTADIIASRTEGLLGWPTAFNRYVPKAWSFGAPVTTGIVYDTSSNSGFQTLSSSYSWSHTCTGANRFLAVDIELLSVAQTVSGITYNGVALSLIGARTTVSSVGRVECWGLIAPATGSNTIAVTLTGAVASAGTAVSYANVNQTTATEAFNSAQATNVGAADATVAITTVTDNDWVHAACVSNDTSITAGQTSRNNVTDSAGTGADEDTNAAVSPAGVQTMSYTGIGAGQTWAIAGYGIRPVSASGAYTLNAAPGSFVYTGTTATLLNDQLLNAATGTFNLTGTVATLLWDQVLNAATGSFLTTGSPVTFLRGLAINAVPGAFLYTGAAATLLNDQILNAVTGIYAYTGTAAALLLDRTLNAAMGSFLTTGSAATFLLGRVLNAVPGEFVYTGTAATLLNNQILNAATGTFTYTGIAATLVYTQSNVLNASPGVFTYTGLSAGLLVGHKLNAATGSFLTTGSVAGFVRGKSLNAATGSFNATGTAAGFARNRIMVAAPASFTLTGIAATLAYTPTGTGRIPTPSWAADNGVTVWSASPGVTDWTVDN